MRALAVLGLCLAAQPVLAAEAGLSVQIDQVRAGALTFDDIELQLPAVDGGAGQVRVGRLRYGARQWSPLRVRCSALFLAEGSVNCRGGRVDGPGALAGSTLTFTLDPGTGGFQATLGLSGGGQLRASRQTAGATRLELTDVRLDWLAALVGGLPEGWTVSGQANGQLTVDADQAVLALGIREAGFSDAAGMHAAEGVRFELAGRLDGLSRGSGPWQFDARWIHGEAFWNPVLVAPGWSISARGRLDARQVVVDALSASGPGLARMRFSGTLDRACTRPVDGDVRIDGADLAELVPRFVLPLVVPAHAERWKVAGTAGARLRWANGALEAVRISLDQAGFSYLGQRFRVGPVSGVIPWHREQGRQLTLNVDGLHWQKLDFQPFALMADVRPDGLHLMPTRMPLLDGALIVDGLALSFGDDGWRGRGHLYSEPIDLSQLTAALDLPEMAGTVSVSVPGIDVSPERIALDGALVMSVFDGYLQATGLEITDPFGLLPQLRANVSAEHIDLAQLTQTFSFGAVSGYVDARVDDLWLANWKPVRFDARVGSSPGNYRRRISQRAVEHITALGGAGAMAAIQRSVLRLFDDFGYRRIGFSCQLRGNVCRMAGLDEDVDAVGPFSLVEGGGIPALNVIGYNRRVDWAELLERVSNATAGDAGPVIQ
ncbi:MAG: hypothetical protein CMK33_04190 [Porticoccaceae bacterium]|nr:hypothetical protein [Porticoccaceae bacterium]